MAYNVSKKYKEKRYSGDNDNQLYLEYNGVEVKDVPLKAENLKWVRRILDNGSKTLTLDNFVSQTIELSIRDYEVSDTTKEFYIKIGSMVDGAYEYVPLGYYHIKDNPSTANGKTTYKLTDRSTRFDKFIDLSEFIKQNGGKITKLQAVQEYCRQCNVEFANTSFLGSNEEIGIYDNTITARIHIMYLAECSGCIATIGRDGKLYFIPFVKPNSNNTHIIPERILNNNMNNSKGSFKISKVVWEGSLMPFSKGNDTGDTLFLNTSNPYISKQEDIDRIYEQVVGLEIDNINTSSIIGDPSIDPWDYIQYTHTDDNGNNKGTYTSLSQYDLEFNGVFKQTFNTSIDREKKKINSTVNSPSAKFKRIRQEIDETNATLKVVAEQVDDVEKTTQVIKNATGNPIEISNAGNYDMLELLISGNREGITGNIELFFKGEQKVETIMLTENNKKILTEDNREIIVYVPNYQRLYLDIGDIVLYELDGVADTYNVITGIITKRVDKNNRGELYILDNPYEVKVEPIKLQTYEGHNYIYVYGNPSQLSLNYLTDSYYNQHFSTKAELYIASDEIKTSIRGEFQDELGNYTKTTEMNNIIDQKVSDSENSIMLEVNKKVDDEDYTRAKIMAKITENGTSAIDMEADKFSLTSDNFKVDTEGNLEAKSAKLENANIVNGDIKLTDDGTTTNVPKIIIESNDKKYMTELRSGVVSSPTFGLQSEYVNGIEYANDINYQKQVIFNNGTLSWFIDENGKCSFYGIDSDDKNFAISSNNINLNGANLSEDNGGLTIQSKQSSNSKAGTNGIWLGAGGNITLNPGDNSKAYVRVGSGSSYAISTAGGNLSSANLKNIKDKFDSVDYNEALKLLDYINLYHYDYKYKINDYDNNYGFIIDELEENDLTKKFFNFEDNKAVITENNTLDEELATREDNQEKVINYKRYDNDVLIKYLLTVCKAQQKCIENLQNDVNELKSMLSKEN